VRGIDALVHKAKTAEAFLVDMKIRNLSSTKFVRYVDWKGIVAVTKAA